MRQDLNPLEEAQAYRRLVDEFGLSQADLASRLGRSRSAVANCTASPEPQRRAAASLARGEISEGHARAHPQSARRGDAAAVVESRWCRKGLSVRQTEELVRAGSGAKKAARRRAAGDPGGGSPGGATARGLGDERQRGEGATRRPDNGPFLQRRGAGGHSRSASGVLVSKERDGCEREDLIESWRRCRTGLPPS